MKRNLKSSSILTVGLPKYVGLLYKLEVMYYVKDQHPEETESRFSEVAYGLH